MKVKYFLLSLIAFSHSILAVNQNSIVLPRAVGQMMMVGFKGTTVNENSVIVKEIKQYHIGGVILDNHRDPNTHKIITNVENPIQLKHLISQLQFYAKKYHDYPLFIAINQEGGLINTLKSTQGFNNANDPSQFDLGKKGNQEMIFHETLKRARLLKELGINVNLAPVADLNINPENPAISKLQRSFGSDPKQVTEDLKTTINAYNKAKILCTLKHFPGLGSANQNTDYAKTDLTQTWTDIELLPYKNLIQSNNSCQFIMVSHLINKQLDQTGVPATLSQLIISDLLVKKLGYNGLVITDDMDAKAIRNHFSNDYAIKKAMLAGNDIIIYGGTQGYDPDKDAEMLFNIMLELANTNSEIHNHVLKSYSKIMKIKSSMI
jgi:beta-N-acetylhexosaminidase